MRGPPSCLMLTSFLTLSRGAGPYSLAWPSPQQAAFSGFAYSQSHTFRMLSLVSLVFGVNLAFGGNLPGLLP